MEHTDQLHSSFEAEGGDDGTTACDHSFDDIIVPEDVKFEEPRVRVTLSWHDIKVTAKAPKNKTN